MSEADGIEYKRTLDLAKQRDKVKLVKTIVALANSGGGTIHIGRDDDGTATGISERLAVKLDPARIGDLVESFIQPDRLEINVVSTPVAEGKLVVINVPAHPNPPLVMSMDGKYSGDGGTSQLFSKGAVIVRRSTRSQPATRNDFVTWTEAAVERDRRRFLENVTLLVEAPDDVDIRLVSAEGVVDPPSALLSKQTDLFSVRPEKLLSAEDLAFLWQNRTGLSLGVNERRLLFQSSLRKRATLFPWLAIISPSSAEIEGWLPEALSINDRDKSDAGRGMLMVAALYLDNEQYSDLAQRLASSRYSHFRAAARRFPTSDDARASLVGMIDGLLIEGRPAEELSGPELLAYADTLIAEGRNRPVPAVGLAYLLHSQRDTGTSLRREI